MWSDSEEARKHEQDKRDRAAENEYYERQQQIAEGQRREEEQKKYEEERKKQEKEADERYLLRQFDKLKNAKVYDESKVEHYKEKIKRLGGDPDDDPRDRPVSSSNTDCKIM